MKSDENNQRKLSLEDWYTERTKLLAFVTESSADMDVIFLGISENKKYKNIFFINFKN